MEDFELNDTECPSCGQCPTHVRDCNRCCGEGYLDDLFEEYPLWYQPGDSEECSECNGTGVYHWCPNCGADISSSINDDNQEDIDYPIT